MPNNIRSFKNWVANQTYTNSVIFGLHKGFYASLNFKELEELGFDEYLKKHQIVFEEETEQQPIPFKPYYDNNLSYLILAWLRWWEEGDIESREEVEEWRLARDREEKINAITKNQELKEIIEKVKEQLKEEIKMINEVLNN